MRPEAFARRKPRSVLEAAAVGARAVLGGLLPLLESAPSLAFEHWRRGWGRRRDGRRRLSLLALRYGEQLGDALVEPRELGDELGDLGTKLRVFFPQRFELIHRPVEITLGDPCRPDSSLFSRVEVGGTTRVATL